MKQLLTHIAIWARNVLRFADNWNLRQWYNSYEICDAKGMCHDNGSTYILKMYNLSFYSLQNFVMNSSSAVAWFGFYSTFDLSLTESNACFKGIFKRIHQYAADSLFLLLGSVGTGSYSEVKALF